MNRGSSRTKFASSARVYQLSIIQRYYCHDCSFSLPLTILAPSPLNPSAALLERPRQSLTCEKNQLRGILPSLSSLLAAVFHNPVRCLVMTLESDSHTVTDLVLVFDNEEDSLIITDADFPLKWRNGQHPDDYKIISAPLEPEFSKSLALPCQDAVPH